MGTIKANQLKPGSEFRLPEFRKFRSVLRVVELPTSESIPMPYRGKLLVILNDCKQLVLDPEQDVTTPFKSFETILFCTVTCAKCKVQFSESGLSTTLFANKEEAIQVIQNFEWRILDTGDAISDSDAVCGACVKKYTDRISEVEA